MTQQDKNIRFGTPLEDKQDVGDSTSMENSWAGGTPLTPAQMQATMKFVKGLLTASIPNAPPNKEKGKWVVHDVSPKKLFDPIEAEDEHTPTRGTTYQGTTERSIRSRSRTPRRRVTKATPSATVVIRSPFDEQESSRLLAGEKGYARLNSLQKMLRARHQYMISQVSYLYPVKTLIGATQELELDLFPNGGTQGTSGGSVDENMTKNPGTLSISGVQLSMRPFTQMSLFTDKNQMQKSTTALGYVAQAISLIALYLHVPLRYPLRLGGSHSYIKDCAPLFELSSSGSSSNALVSANKKCLEFPLFLDGQDATRASYAIFLLNKDIEQLLNYVGVESLGPRHVLVNLKELYRTILSPAFVEKEML